MRQLYVVATTEAEHQSLCELWRFYRGHQGLTYLYYHPADAEMPVFEASFDFAAFPLSEGNVFTLEIAGKSPANKGSQVVCFAGRAALMEHFRRQSDPFIPLYCSDRHQLADLGAIPNPRDPALIELANRSLGGIACLERENDLRDFFPEARIVPNISTYLDEPDNLTLMTRNADLLESLTIVQPANFSFMCLSKSLWGVDLAVGSANSDYLDRLNRMDHASLLALDYDSKAQDSAQPTHVLPRARQTSYSLFAGYYDQYMEHVNYDDWVNLMVNWYKRHTDQPLRKILELACGTANASEILVFRGCEVDACDSSPHMLHVADTKAFKPNLFACSLTDPLPEKNYDLAFCLFDSINYLTQRAEVSVLLKNVKTALRPGGIFIFDISTLLNSLQNFNETTNYTKVSDGFLIQLSRFEILSHRQITQLTLFRKSRLGYERLEERHVQRVYRCPELVELIAGSGLKLLAIHSPDYKTNLLPRLGGDLDNRYVRLFFILRNEA